MTELNISKGDNDMAHEGQRKPSEYINSQIAN